MLPRDSSYQTCQAQYRLIICPLLCSVPLLDTHCPAESRRHRHLPFPLAAVARFRASISHWSTARCPSRKIVEADGTVKLLSEPKTPSYRNCIPYHPVILTRRYHPSPAPSQQHPPPSNSNKHPSPIPIDSALQSLRRSTRHKLSPTAIHTPNPRVNFPHQHRPR